MNKITTLLIFTGMIAISPISQAASSTTGSLNVSALGYVMTAPTDLGIIQFPNITLTNLTTSETQEGGPIQFSAITTYPPEYPDPNLSLHVTVGDNHIEAGRGAYLTNPAAPKAKIFYTLSYSPCNDAGVQVPLIQAALSPTPTAEIDNAHASIQVCASNPGHLTFTRSAISNGMLPPAGLYSGTINIVAAATPK